MDGSSQIETVVQLPDFLVLACDGDEGSEEVHWTVTPPTPQTTRAPKMRSLVWKYFRAITADEVKCNICTKTLKNHRGTSSLRKHLKTCHHSVFVEMTKDTNQIHLKNEDMVTINYGGEEEPSQDWTPAPTKAPRKSGPKIRSTVWKYFSYCSQKESKCNMCSKIIQTWGGTTNMRKHLKNRHKIQFSQLNKGMKFEQPEDHQDMVVLPCDGDVEGSQEVCATDVYTTATHHNSSKCRSLVWKYFTFISRREAKCITCLKIVKMCGGTTNLRRHLERWHHSVYSQIESEGISEESRVKTSETKLQPSQDKIMKRPAKILENKKAAINHAILYMVCKDGLPLSVTDNEGFKFFLKTTAPSYEVPDREQMINLLQEKYKCLREVVDHQFKQAEWVSISADLASVANKGFLIVCGHYIDHGHLRSICLGVSEATPSDTSDQIASNLSEILNLWNLETKKICSITTYDGENITSAVHKIMGNKDSHVPCVATLLNLCVCRALSHSEKVTTVFEKVKHIVTYFRRNLSASEALRLVQHESGTVVPLELIQAVATRWSTIFYSLERFMELASCLSQVLLSEEHQNGPPMLTADELAIVTDSLKVLRPFKEATKEICGKKLITATTVLPIVNCLTRAVSIVSIVNEDVQALNNALLNQIKLLLFPLEDNNLLASAAVLDPRFKVIHFRSVLSGSNILQCISQEIRTLTEENISKANPQQSEALVSDGNDSLWEIHDQLATSKSVTEDNHQESSTEINPELKIYLDLPMAARTKCPLKMWLELEMTFPTVAQVARKYLTVMGSAVASDRLVSHLNTSVSDWRNRLSPSHLNMLLFLSSQGHEVWFSE